MYEHVLVCVCVCVCPHHAVRLVIIAKHREAPPLSELGHLYDGLIINGPGDDHSRGVGWTHTVVPVDMTQPPLVVLHTETTMIKYTIIIGITQLYNV